MLGSIELVYSRQGVTNSVYDKNQVFVLLAIEKGGPWNESQN